MKTPKEIRQSRNGARNNLRKAAERIIMFCDVDKQGEPLTRAAMVNAREDANEVGQRFHEFNAYVNTLEEIGENDG